MVTQLTASLTRQWTVLTPASEFWRSHLGAVSLAGLPSPWLTSSNYLWPSTSSEEDSRLGDEGCACMGSKRPWQERPFNGIGTKADEPAHWELFFLCLRFRMCVCVCVVLVFCSFLLWGSFSEIRLIGNCRPCSTSNLIQGCLDLGSHSRLLWERSKSRIFSWRHV